MITRFLTHSQPLSHPFTWGRDAPSIVPVEVEDILDLLHGRSEGSLLEGINMVTAIECDNSFAMNLRKWRTWTRQIARVFVQPCSRSLQFPQYMLVVSYF
jgi:hypothetical protein